MPISVFDIFPDGTAKVPRDIQLSGPGSYRWWHYDLSDPDLADWSETQLPDIPRGALLQAETRPRCDLFEDGLMLNLRGINLNAGQDADHMVSIRMWVSAEAIVSVRLRKVFALDEIRQETMSDLAPPNPAQFLSLLISKLTERVQTHVTALAHRTEFFEADLEDPATPIPAELPATRRSVIRLRRYLEPQRAALNRLAGLEIPLLPHADRLDLREMANRTTIAVEELDALRERLVAVQDEHDMSIAQKQARHGYALSLVAALFLPAGFLTGLFGVNVAGMPGLTSPHAFWMLCASLVILAIALLLYMKFRHWF